MTAVLFCLALGAAAVAAPAPAPTAPPVVVPRPVVLRGKPVDVKTVDGWVLKGVWQKADPGKPTLVLLHGTGQRKEDWRLLTRFLARDGFGYLALDLRGHGESRVTPAGETITWKKLRVSKEANDYEDMTRDAEAAVGYLVQQGVSEQAIGLAGAEVGGSIALKYAAVHPKAPFVILLSPGLRWQEVLTVNALFAFKGRTTPILMIYSDADKRSSKETPLMYAIAKNAIGEAHAAQIEVPEEKGTRLLKVNRGLTAKVLAWIANPVPPSPLPAPSTAPAVGTAVSSTTLPIVVVEEPEDDDSDTFSGSPAPSSDP